MFETTISGVYYPKRVSATILESHSKTASFRPTSQAKDTHTSMAFASISSGPNGWWNPLLKVVVTLPSWSQIITPTPVCQD